MRLQVLVLSVFLALFSNSVFSKEITFASFNAFWLFDDQEPHKKWWDSQRGKQGQTYEQAIGLVAETIKDLDADVIALQEIEDDNIIVDLKSKLKGIGADYPYHWVGNGTDPRTGQNVALLSKYPKTGKVVGRYDDERETYLTESDPGNEKDAELSKILRVDLKIEGEVVSVFATHLKSQRGGVEADNQRLAQASILRRLTLPLIQDGKHVVVMGDLNADRGSKTLLRLRGLDDVFADLGQTVYDKNFKGDKWTYKYAGRPTQLDHILVSPSLRENIISGSIDYSYDRRTSDHFAIKVGLNIE